MPYKDPTEQKEAQARAYQNRKEHYGERVKNRKREIHEWYRELKKKYKCQVCGENHPDCLDFHHRDPSTKRKTVSMMAWNGFAKETILEEIAKCDPLCSNCHRKQHRSELDIGQNWNGSGRSPASRGDK